MTLQRYLLCALLSFLAVVLVVVPSSHAEDEFDLELKTVFPCQETPPDSNVSLYRSDILAVQANLTFCNSSRNISQYNGFRMHAKAETNSTYPVIFIARQNSNGTVSFSVPLQLEGFSLTFTDVSRTLCPVEYPSVAPTLFYIDVFTSSPEPMNYSVKIDPVDDFTLSLNKTYHTVISPSSPQIFYFKMPEGVNVVTVDVATDSKRCAIVSVQNKTCPVNDLLENARSKGIYQTMSTSAVLTVEASQVMDREFLLVLIATSYSVCHDKMPDDGNDTYDQFLDITIKQLKPMSTYWRAFVLPVVVFFIFPYSLTFIVLYLCSPKLRCVPTWDFKHPFKKPFKCVGPLECPFCSCCLKHLFCCCKQGTDNENISLVQENGASTKNYRTIDNSQSQATPTYRETSKSEQMNGKVNDMDSDTDDSEQGNSGLLDSGSGEVSIKYETDEGKMMVPRISKKGYTKLHKRYAVYGWNAITVGIFYALPAFQLVLSEQRILNFSGDQDQCYYNFKCTHPLGVLSAFNNVFSNIGYVLLGFLFLIVVFVRDCCHRKRREVEKAYVDGHGLPKFFGIYYAMGIALVLEGFMSSFYHICPNDANFQFDTAFMFIIGGLLLVKIFQQRHPDIHANAFIAFFSFAVIIICTLVGIYFSRKDPIATRLPIFLLILSLLVAFFVSFYYFHDWKLGNLWMNFVKLVKSWIPRKNCKGPIHKVRFFKLLIAFIVNIILAMVAIVGYKALDIATAILAFFLVNLILFLVMYVLSKLWFKEPLTWLAIVLPIAIAMAWGAAFYFFMGVPVTDWSATPAGSREINKECALLDFYDNHDVWHFLSAFGMFFAFMFVLVLDDGVEDIERVDLHIF